MFQDTPCGEPTNILSLNYETSLGVYKHDFGVCVKPLRDGQDKLIATFTITYKTKNNKSFILFLINLNSAKTAQLY